MDEPLPALELRNPHGWRPDDRHRPCYTCGAPSTGRYPNGSPSYSCGPHPPITVYEPYPWPAPYETGWTLTEADIATAHHWTKEWLAAAAALPESEMTFPPPRGYTEYEVKFLGICAEIAGSHVTGLEWHPRRLTADYRKSRKVPDLGRRVEVRLSLNDRGPLTLRENDRDDWYGLQVVGRPPRMEVIGWFTVGDAKRRAEFEVHGHRRHGRQKGKAYVEWRVPQRELRSLPLPADA